MTDEELAERLKDVADDLGLYDVSAVRQSGDHSWTTVRVTHASVFSESEDGWTVQIGRSDF